MFATPMNAPRDSGRPGMPPATRRLEVRSRHTSKADLSADIADVELVGGIVVHRLEGKVAPLRTANRPTRSLASRRSPANDS